MKVIAFEGRWTPEDIVTAASAALSDGMHITNAHTRFSVPLGELDGLVTAGHVTKLSKEFELRQEHENCPLVVVAFNRRHKAARFLTADQGRGDILAAHSLPTIHEYLFRDWISVKQYSDEKLASMIQSMLELIASPAANTNSDDLDVLELSRIGLILDRRHPEMNALRAFLLRKSHPFAPRIARDNVQEVDLKRFDNFTRMLERIESKSAHYKLKYEHGVAAQGGLPISTAASIFATLNDIRKITRNYIEQHVPYAGTAPEEQRVELLKAASAEIVFKADLEARSLREKVAAYVELQILAQIFRGKEVSGLVIDSNLRKRIDDLLCPTAETIVTHTPVDADEEELIGPVEPSVSESKRSEPFTMLGFQSGQINDAARVEMRFFPKLRRMVSAREDDLGQPPAGADLITGVERTNYRPTLLTLVREWDTQGHEAFHMRRFRLLRDADIVQITAIPSTIVPGAILTGISIDAELTNGDLKLAIGSIGGTSRHSLEDAKGWLREYERLCRNFELTESKGTYLPPSKIPGVNALERVLVAIARYEIPTGRALVTDIVSYVSRYSDVPVRDNNTRRVVIRNSEMINFDGEDSQFVYLSDVGRRYLKAYQNAVGRPLWPDNLS